MPSAERKKSLAQKAQSLAANVELALPYLSTRGISREAAEMFGLGYDEAQRRVSIPYWTPTGVVQIKYRCADLAHGDHKTVECMKYLHESGLGTHLYNAQVLATAVDTVVVTEGELDVVCVQAYCGIPAVAYPGVQTWGKQPHYRLCFEAVNEVIVIADGDKVGREAADRVAESISTSRARVVRMPEGHDANSFIIERGVAEFEARLWQ